MDNKRLRIFLIGIRQLMLMGLGLIEDFLGIKRSVVPKRKRGKE